MTNTALALHRPSLVGRNVFDDLFDNLFNDFPSLVRQTTQGYPVSDLYKNEKGETVLEFALAGFAKEELSIEVKPEKRSVVVSAQPDADEGSSLNRRIARRSFKREYVDFDNNLDFSAVSANFENGLLQILIPLRLEAAPLTIEIK